MNKDHFPVNDKTIADVNKANARAYSADAPLKSVVTASVLPKGSGVVSTAMSKVPKGLKTLQQSVKGSPVAADHVRESSQEHGEDSTPNQRTERKQGELSKLSQFHAPETRNEAASKLKAIKRSSGSTAARSEQSKMMSRESGIEEE